MRRRGWRDLDPRLGAGLLLLVLLWLAAAVPAVLGATDRVRDRTTADRLGRAVDAAVVALQEERRLSVAFLAGGEASGLAVARAHTGRMVTELSSRAHTYDSDAVRAVDEWTASLGTLGGVRSQVDARKSTRLEVLAAYQGVIGAGLGMPWLPAGAPARAREALSAEDALLRAALGTTAGVSDAELLRVGGLAGERRAWLASAPAAAGNGDLLDGGAAAAITRLDGVEEQLLLGRTPRIAPAGWAAVADPAMAALREAETRAVRNALDSAMPRVIGAIVYAGLVAGVGLIAVVAVLVTARRSLRAPRQLSQTTGPVADTATPGVHDLLLDMHVRSQRLLHRLLRLLDGMERRQGDDETLGELFRADHLATRMRRNVEKAITLAGGTPGRQWHEPAPLSEVVRGAAAEVDDYQRVSTAQVEPAALAGDAVLEVTHLLAELIENAVTYSPAETRVRVGGDRDDTGYTITVSDAGPGMTDLDLDHARQVMADSAPPGGGLWSGFYAVGRFAAARGIDVRLSGGPAGGLVAEVRLPAELISDELGEMSDPARPYVDLSVVGN